jgi:hypothetical protein
MSTSKSAWVRFPNTSYFEEILHFDWEKFTPTNEFDDEVFGTYAGMTIAIKKEKNDEQIRQTISGTITDNS